MFLICIILISDFTFFPRIPSKLLTGVINWTKLGHKENLKVKINTIDIREMKLRIE